MLKKAFRKVKNKLGLTMVEVLIVVGIIAVTTGIAIPTFISVSNNNKLAKHNDYAKAIYLAAQNNLNQMRAAGELGMVVQASKSDHLAKEYMPATASTKGFYYSYSKTDDDSYNLIVPGSLDHTIRNQDVIVEYNPKSGVVYSVFYMESKDNAEENVFSYYTDSYKNAVMRGEEGTSDNERKKLGVGYYSVEQDGLATLAETEFQVVHTTSELVYVNGQEGYLTLKLPMMYEGQTTTFFSDHTRYVKGLEVELTVTGENGGEYTRTYISDTVTPPEGSTATPVTFKYIYTPESGTELAYFAVWVDIPMDSLRIDGSFTEKPENAGSKVNSNLIAAGDNVTVTADITFYPSAYTEEEKAANTALKDDPIVIIDSATLAAVNPMFHSLTRDPKADDNSTNPYILAISNGRHLQNLEHLKPDFIQKIKTIVFTHPDAEVQTPGTIQSGSNQPQTAAAANGDPVLDWALTAETYLSGNSLEDELPRALNPIDFYGRSENSSVNTSIPKLVIDGNNVTIKNLSVNNPSTAGGAGLFGKLANVEIRNIHLENPNVVPESSNNNINTGALAGETQNVIIQNCSVSNDATADKPTLISGKKFVGGLVGYANADSQLIDCNTSAHVTGAGSIEGYVGGLVGYALNAKFSGCRAIRATVESSSLSAGDEDKHALGGLVGAVEVKTDSITVNEPTFLECRTDATTTVISSPGALCNLGGFVGLAKNTIFGDPIDSRLQCISYASVTGSKDLEADSSSNTKTVPNNNLGGFVGRSERSTYYHPKVYQYTLPQYAKDAGGFSGILAGDEVYSLSVEFDIPVGKTQALNIINFGGIASRCNHYSSDSTTKLAKVINADVEITSVIEIKTDLQNTDTRAAGAFAILDNYSRISQVRVNQSEWITGTKYIAGFAVDVGSGVNITESYFKGTLAEYGTGFVRNNKVGIIQQCYANPTVNNGYAFVRENTGIVKNCFAWAKGSNTVEVAGATYSYFGSYNENNKLNHLKFYEDDNTKASKNITTTDALADAWAVELLNAPADRDHWTTGIPGGYPYPMLLKYTESADSTEPTVETIPYDMGYPSPEASLYPYALLYIETYTDNTTGELVVHYTNDGKVYSVENGKAPLKNQDVRSVAYYLCHRTDDTTFGTPFKNRSSKDFESWMEKFNMSANKLYSIYALADNSSYKDGTITTKYPRYDINGAYRIRTAEQFARISGSTGTFYVDNNFTADGSLSGFSGELIGDGNPVITVNSPLFTTLSGNISGISVAAKISGGENIGAIAGTMTGGSISGCSVSGSVSGTGNTGGVVGTVSGGTLQNVTTTATVTGAGAFVGYASGGSFDSCTASASGNLPFGQFAKKTITGATHHSTYDVRGSTLLYVGEYFQGTDPKFESVDSAPVEQVDVPLTDCKLIVNGQNHDVLSYGHYYYAVDMNTVMAENYADGGSGSVDLTKISAPTYKRLLDFYTENTIDGAKVKTDYYAADSGKYSRVYIYVHSADADNDGNLEYTFQYLNNENAQIKEETVLAADLNNTIGLQLFSVPTSDGGVLSLSGGVYLLKCNSGYIGYATDGSIQFAAEVPSNAVNFLWTSDGSGGWSSYLNTDNTVLTTTWTFANGDFFTGLIDITGNANGINVHESSTVAFAVQRISTHYAYQNLGRSSTPYIPTGE